MANKPVAGAKPDTPAKADKPVAAAKPDTPAKPDKPALDTAAKTMPEPVASAKLDKSAVDTAAKNQLATNPESATFQTRPRSPTWRRPGSPYTAAQSCGSA